MLMATKLTNEGFNCESATEEVKSRIVLVVCPSCGSTTIKAVHDLDDIVCSDSRNPDDECFVCTCGYEQHLMNSSLPLKDMYTNKEYNLMSDGTFLYLKEEDHLWRI